MDTDNSCYEDCPETLDTDEDEEDDDGVDYMDEYDQMREVGIGYIARGKDVVKLIDTIRVELEIRIDYIARARGKDRLY